MTIPYQQTADAATLAFTALLVALGATRVELRPITANLTGTLIPVDPVMQYDLAAHAIANHREVWRQAVETDNTP